MEIGKIIKSQRIKCGMTQEALAEKLSVSRTAVAKWEQGYSVPTSKHIAELSAILNIGIARLYNDSVPKSETEATLEQILKSLNIITNEIQILLKNI